MLNKLAEFIRRYDMARPGDRVICAVSGGADSVALLAALYLLRDKLGIRLEAAHFNHHLRGAESTRDQEFVEALCRRYDIALHLGEGRIQSGEKGLEAAAREARYAFFKTLSGKIATAHTCDDNAETVLMRLVRGTGLKGLGGIAPVRGNIIRPMLTVSRAEVLAFLSEYHLEYVEDSSNGTDDFLRNRLRRHVMPLLKAENPEFAGNTSAMALRLRQDEQALEELAGEQTLSVSRLRGLPPALRSRCLSRFLIRNGVREPEAGHIAMAEKLVFSENPSAWGNFPGNVWIRRRYDVLEKGEPPAEPFCLKLTPGETVLPQSGLRVRVTPAGSWESTPHRFTVPDLPEIVLRSRQPGDRIRTGAGTKSLKKLFIDRKITACLRDAIPVAAQGERVLGVWGVGADLNTRNEEAGWLLEFLPL